MESNTSDNRSTLLELAHSLNALVPDEVRTLTGWSDQTLKAYRKRRIGPAYVRFGKHYLYPRSAIADFMARNTRERNSVAKGLL